MDQLVFPHNLRSSAMLLPVVWHPVPVPAAADVLRPVRTLSHFSARGHFKLTLDTLENLCLYNLSISLRARNPFDLRILRAQRQGECRCCMIYTWPRTEKIAPRCSRC
ncbi:hypothetical protein PYCCODRAFT_1007940 [Trametes coccinea BRFM310]|uniref:Uncharacterized protein n=1 Tax=Trametes coccinea (strain BRFM310) TaxID=1353009 RepID=A0A1Y2IER0_TRAC3|nr:hypothetical protein PYCCODRAFT_1007940 [Trametes coccinea BRFM310]